MLNNSPTVGGPNKRRKDGDELHTGVGNTQDTSQQAWQIQALDLLLPAADAPGALEVDDNDVRRATRMHDATSSICGAHAWSGDAAGARRRGIGPLMSGSGSANFASVKRPVRGMYWVQLHVTMSRS